MTYKASELQSRFAEIKEEIRRKKAVLQFEHCLKCGTKLELKFEMRRAEQVVIESGDCPHCGDQVSPRKFKLC